VAYPAQEGDILRSMDLREITIDDQRIAYRCKD